MRIIKQKKGKFKIPVIKDKFDNIVAIGNRRRIDDMNLSKFEETEMENAVFETRIKFNNTYYSGYSNYVWFESDTGMVLLMQNRGVIKLIKLVSKQKVMVDSYGYFHVRFTYGKSKHRFHINPVE